MSNLKIIGISMLVVVVVSFLFYREHTEKLALKIKLAAIENPETKQNVVTVREVVEKVLPSGEKMVVVKETINSNQETRVATVDTKSFPPFYLSGTYGYNVERSDYSYGVGAGYNISETVSIGVRYDNFNQGGRVGVEVRINF